MPFIRYMWYPKHGGFTMLFKVARNMFFCIYMIARDRMPVVSRLAYKVYAKVVCYELDRMVNSMRHHWRNK